MIRALGIALAGLLFAALCLLGPRATAFLSTQGMMMGSPAAPSAAPPSGGVPAPAARAGFTARVLQADFTASGTVNIANNAPVLATATNQYIVNCGAAVSQANTPSSWHFSYFQWQTPSNLLPCPSNVGIVTDSVFGNQALNINLNVGQLSNDNSGLSWPAVSGSGTSTSWLPNEGFRIIRFRTDCPTWYQAAGGGPPRACQNVTHSGVIGDSAIWSQTANDFTSWADENDYEMRYPGGNFGVWQGGIQANNPTLIVDGPASSADVTQYTTVATLWTSDESTVNYMCQWVNPSADYSTGFAGCTHITFTTSTYTQRSRYLIWGLGVQGGRQTDPMNFWITRLELWECPNYNSTTCPGTPVTTWP